MYLTSQSFTSNGKIPKKFTCEGENVNPSLVYSDIPDGTISLALILEDPDAMGGIFYHWVIWNLDPNIGKIDENALKIGFETGKNSSHQNSYFGPCPPIGNHRYYFKLYALDTKLDLNSDTSAIQLRLAMKDHILAECELMGTYEKEG